MGKKFGKDAAAVGGLRRPTQVIPTGILGLDYALGTGGWARGHQHIVYGPNDIGKSSALGLGAIREAQKLGLVPAIIAMEPYGDERWREWAAKHGVDPDNLVISYPDNGEQAFSHLTMMVNEGADFILFDSIGAVISEKEQEEDGITRVGGQSGLITRGVKAVANKVYKNDVAVLYLNQIRDNMNGPGYDMPGGNALKHATTTRVRIGPTKNRYTMKLDGDDVVIGREVRAVIERNKLAEGSNMRATFNFYQMEVEGYPFGIDTFTDIVNTGVRAGVIGKRGAYFDVPGKSKAIQGFESVKDYLASKPETVELIRKGVLEAMDSAGVRPELKAVDG